MLSFSLLHNEKKKRQEKKSRKSRENNIFLSEVPLVEIALVSLGLRSVCVSDSVHTQAVQPQALKVLTSPARLGLGSSLEPPQLPSRNCPGDTSERRNRSMERTYERRTGTECVGFLDLLRRQRKENLLV